MALVVSPWGSAEVVVNKTSEATIAEHVRDTV
jgi:hypothetical protein